MALTASQFGQAVQVEVIPSIGDGVLINPDVSPGAVQLRCSVQVTKAISSPATPSSCSVDVWNLATKSRDRAAGATRRIIDFGSEVDALDGRVVFGTDFGDGTAEVVTRSNGFGFLRVSAFYQGAGSTVALFKGSCTSVETQDRRPDQITRITGADGLVQSSAAVTNRQWRDPTTMAVVLEYVVRDVMKTSLAGSTPGDFEAGLPASVRGFKLPAGYDATALYATDILDEFARVTDSEWWWDDGYLYWLDRGDVLPDPPLRLSPTPATGSYRMIRTPQATEPVAGAPAIVAPLLLLPEARLGRAVIIEAGRYKGEWSCRSVTHAVDNRSGRVATTMAKLARRGVLSFL